jgi:maltose-binding protein MalE
MSWDAVTHKQQVWGYPVALEAASLIYNEKLVTGKVPTQLSELPAFGKELKAQQSSRDRHHVGLQDALLQLAVSRQCRWIPVQEDGGGQ